MFLDTGSHRTQRLTLCLRSWAWVPQSCPKCLAARGQTNIRAPQEPEERNPTLGLTRLPMELICDISMPNTPRGGKKPYLFRPKFHSRTKGLVPTSIQIQVWHDPQTEGPTTELPRAQENGWPTTNPDTNSKLHTNPVLTFFANTTTEFQPHTHLTPCWH